MTHSNAHVHILGGDTGHTHTHTGHTHTHAQAEVAVNLTSAFFPSLTFLPPGPQEQWAAFKLSKH